MVAWAVIYKTGDTHLDSPRATSFLCCGQILGPSSRLIIDVGNWDSSKAVNHPGQSGDPDSSHYRDSAPLWRAGEYFPLLYSRESVENATEKKIELVPRSARH